MLNNMDTYLFICNNDKKLFKVWSLNHKKLKYKGLLTGMLDNGMLEVILF